MNNLFVLYDNDCEFCWQCRRWLESQKQQVRLTFIAAGSAEAKDIFPRIDRGRTKTELTAIDENGGVYHDAKAWVMVLWALTEYRSWARRLATPELMPSAKSIIATISKNRKTISKLIA
jgi:predicted DCC family thiol-disulfide oxidoreductase YuxK